MEPDRNTLAFSTNLAALRGIAACMVVVFHALMVFQLSGFDDPHRQSLAAVGLWEGVTLLLLMLFNGHAAVIIFFVLSGVVLTLSYSRERGAGARRLLAYYVKRGSRLWPLLAVVAIVAFPLHGALARVDEPAIFTSWVNGYLAYEPGLRALARNILALDNTLNFPAWTIYIEIAASFLFPALFLLSYTRLLTVTALVGMACLTLLGWNAFGFGQYLVCFMAGITLARYGAPWARALQQWPRAPRVMLLVLAWLAILGVDRVISPTEHMNAVAVLVFTAGATLIVAHMYYAPRIALLDSRPLLWLGEISYGIYLWHFPVLIALAHVAAPHLGVLEPAQALAANLVLAAAAFVVVLPLAGCSYRLLEAPCQLVGRRLAGRIHAFGGWQRVRHPVGSDSFPATRSPE